MSNIVSGTSSSQRMSKCILCTKASCPLKAIEPFALFYRIKTELLSVDTKARSSIAFNKFYFNAMGSILESDRNENVFISIAF